MAPTSVLSLSLFSTPPSSSSLNRCLSLSRSSKCQSSSYSGVSYRLRHDYGRLCSGAKKSKAIPCARRLVPRALSAEEMYPDSPDQTRPSQRVPDIGPLIPPEFENEVVVVNVEKPTWDGVQSKSLRFRLDSTVAVAITAQTAWEFLTLAFKVVFCVKVALQTVSEVTKCVLQGWIGIVPLGFAVGVALARIMAGVSDKEGVLEAEEVNRPKDPRTLYFPPKLQVWLFSLGLAFWGLKFLGPMSSGPFGYFLAHVGTGGLWGLYALFQGVVHGGPAGPPSEMVVRKAMAI